MGRFGHFLAASPHGSINKGGAQIKERESYIFTFSALISEQKCPNMNHMMFIHYQCQLALFAGISGYPDIFLFAYSDNISNG